MKLENEVYVFVLASGEQIISEYEKEENNMIILKRPVRITLRQTTQNQVSIGFSPWIIGSKDKFPEKVLINKDGITTISEVKNDIITEYKNLTSDIKAPPSNSNLIQIPK